MVRHPARQYFIPLPSDTRMLQSSAMPPVYMTAQSASSCWPRLASFSGICVHIKRARLSGLPSDQVFAHGFLSYMA
jgi:hypothetical protein